MIPAYIKENMYIVRASTNLITDKITLIINKLWYIDFLFYMYAKQRYTLQ